MSVRELEGRRRVATVVLAAIAYNCIFIVAGLIADTDPLTKASYFYFELSAVLAIFLSIAISGLLDRRMRTHGLVSWRFVLCISFVFTLVDLPISWIISAGLHFGLLEFLSLGLVTGVTTFSLWSLLHLCIRSAERALDQERRTAALREAMLRYENEVLSGALDSGFFVEALMRIAWALNDQAGGLAGEIVMSLAERLRAALGQKEAPREERIEDAFADSLRRAEASEMTDASLRRLLMIGAVAVWTAFFCGFFCMDIFGGRPWLKSLSDYGPQSIVGALSLVIADWFLQNARNCHVRSLYLRALLVCFFGIGACAVALFLSFSLRGVSNWAPLPRWICGFELNYVTPIFIGWAAIHLLIDARRRELARLRGAAELREAALNARNAMLRQQVNPHFLFNMLNALYALILDRQFVRARGMVAAVRRFLDRAAVLGQGELVALSNELATQDAYLEIERVRFGDRLKVDRRIDAEVAAAKVPHLILQPLVENAVKYAVSRTDLPVAVEIRARRAGGELVLQVADSGAPEAAPRPPGLGMGLRNVEMRLKSLYGEAGRLACGPLAPAGFLAEVRLPLSR